MTELHYVLEQAVPVQPGVVADPAADLARGRAQLHRTRRNRLAVMGVAAALIVAVPLTYTHQQSSGTSEAGSHLTSVDLVAYTGDQVPGYEVAEVPKGWEIQGGNAFALVVAPVGFADQNTDSFAGKIAVMLASKDEGPLGEGARITVDGRPGTWTTEGDTQQLRFEGKDGRIVDVQVPTSLGWDAAHLARFGAGVQVLTNADQGLG